MKKSVGSCGGTSPMLMRPFSSSLTSLAHLEANRRGSLRGKRQQQPGHKASHISLKCCTHTHTHVQYTYIAFILYMPTTRTPSSSIFHFFFFFAFWKIKTNLCEVPKRVVSPLKHIYAFSTPVKKKKKRANGDLIFMFSCIALRSTS